MDDRGLRTRNVIDDFKDLPQDRIRSIYSEKATSLVVAVESLRGTLNLGSIGRSCNGFGVRRLFYIGRKRFDRRSTCGSEFVLPFEFVDIDFIKSLKDTYLIVGVENNIPEAVDYRNVFFPKNTLMIFGAEESGISKEVKELVDLFVYIPQIGSVRSINCSVAAGILLAEFNRKINA